jgi:hypothetical protein
MTRKPSPSRSLPSPVPAALERLARLAAAGTTPDRMVREAQKIIADWRAEPELDGADLRERLETLRDDLAAGVASAEEQAGDVDQSDKAAARQSTALLKGLQAVHEAVLGEMNG